MKRLENKRKINQNNPEKALKRRTFGQRKSKGELFSSTTKNFHYLRKNVMPMIQQTICDALDPKHHEEWLLVLDHLVQLTKSLSKGIASSSQLAVARKNLIFEDFVDLLIVKKTAALLLNTNTLNERENLLRLFLGSLTFEEANKVLGQVMSEQTKVSEDVVEKDSDITPYITEGLSKPPPNSNKNHHSHVNKGNRLISKREWSRAKFSLKIGQFRQQPCISDSSSSRKLKCNCKCHVNSTSTECVIIKKSSSGGRLGIPAPLFAKTAVIQNIVSSYQASSSKKLQNFLLGLFVGTFSRTELNTYVVPFSREDRSKVSKFRWQNILKCHRERSLFLSSSKESQINAVGSDTSTGVFEKFSSFNKHDSANIGECTQTSLTMARQSYLKGGLSQMSSTFSDSLLQDPYSHQLSDSEEDGLLQSGCSVDSNEASAERFTPDGMDTTLKNDIQVTDFVNSNDIGNFDETESDDGEICEDYSDTYKDIAADDNNFDIF